MSTSLVTALLEIERHVGHGGWDQPARLFALVPTADLLAAEPSLAGQLAVRSDLPADALSSVEQDDFHARGEDPLEALEAIAWPPAVAGVAIVLERAFLSTEHEADLPSDPDAAARFVAAHPERHDMRVVVGVLRDGERHGVARFASHPEDLVGAEDLVPGLAERLAATLD